MNPEEVLKPFAQLNETLSALMKAMGFDTLIFAGYTVWNDGDDSYHTIEYFGPPGHAYDGAVVYDIAPDGKVLPISGSTFAEEDLKFFSGWPPGGEDFLELYMLKKIGSNFKGTIQRDSDGSLVIQKQYYQGD